MKRMSQKGEGLVKLLLLLIILAGAGYAGYVYLWPMLMGPSTSSPQASSDATPTPGEAKGTLAGSPAAQQVQGAQAAGEILGSGR